jgi:hypothetical protein
LEEQRRGYAASLKQPAHHVDMLAARLEALVKSGGDLLSASGSMKEMAQRPDDPAAIGAARDAEAARMAMRIAASRVTVFRTAAMRALFPPACAAAERTLTAARARLPENRMRQARVTLDAAAPRHRDAFVGRSDAVAKGEALFINEMLPRLAGLVRAS